MTLTSSGLLHTQNATAAAEVVRLAAADSGVLDAADSVISTVKNNMLLKGITTFNVSALLGDPKVQAAVVVFIEAAEKAAGPSWLYVLPGVAALPKVSCPLFPLHALQFPTCLSCICQSLMLCCTQVYCHGSCIMNLTFGISIISVTLCAGPFSSFPGHDCCGF